MKTFLAITSLLALIFGLQLLRTQVFLSPVNTYHSLEAENYIPPNQGGPESTQGCGTR